jgi:hypothetical protein
MTLDDEGHVSLTGDGIRVFDPTSEVRG